jgi:hypothetical protein
MTSIKLLFIFISRLQKIEFSFDQTCEIDWVGGTDDSDRDRHLPVTGFDLIRRFEWFYELCCYHSQGTYGYQKQHEHLR